MKKNVGEVNGPTNCQGGRKRTTSWRTMTRSIKLKGLIFVFWVKYWKGLETSMLLLTVPLNPRTS